MSQEWAVTLLLTVVVLAWAAMFLGWRRRRDRDARVPAPAEAPADVVCEGTEVHRGTYVSTTAAGDWLDRIVAHGLGQRSEVEVVADPRGVLLARRGVRDVWIPRADLLAHRRDSGMAGKFVERDGLVVLTWRLGEATLDTGVRPRDRDTTNDMLDALRRLGSSETTPDASSTGEHP